MAYKTILAHWEAPEAADPGPIAAALVELQGRFGAHLTLLAIGVEPGISAYGFGGPGAATIAMQTEAAEAEAETRRAAAAAWIAEAGRADAALGAEARAVRGPIELLAETLAEEAKLADLVVVAAPYASLREDLAVGVLEASLFDAAAPVLVLPEAPVERIGQRVMIAWDGGLEARHAVRAAMGFLADAERVEIVLVDPEPAPDGAPAPGAGIATLLSRHGIAAEIAALESGGRRVGTVLAERMSESGADLLVMGAYGHSRLREALIGGPTREILKAVPGPVLMAH